MSTPPTVTQVPRSETERLELLAAKPTAWEYLLFGYYLRSGLERTEEKWRDYSLGYTLKVRPRVERNDLAAFVSEQMSLAGGMAANVERVIGREAQDAAFGVPGEPGDPKMIEHMANRLISVYESLLDWASDFLAHRFPDDSDLGASGAQMVSQPIVAVRGFTQKFISELEDGLRRLVADPDQPLNLSLALTFEMDASIADSMVKDVKRASGKHG